MSTTVVNVPLPIETYNRLLQVAARLEKPAADVLNDTLQVTLPAEQGIPSEIQHEVETLKLLTTGELRQVAASEMEIEDQAALEQLLDFQCVRPLTKREMAKLEKLRIEYGRILLRKARAFALLALRFR